MDSYQNLEIYMFTDFLSMYLNVKDYGIVLLLALRACSLVGSEKAMVWIYGLLSLLYLPSPGRLPGIWLCLSASYY